MTALLSLECVLIEGEPREHDERGPTPPLTVCGATEIAAQRPAIEAGRVPFTAPVPEYPSGRGKRDSGTTEGELTWRRHRKRFVNRDVSPEGLPPVWLTL